MLLQTFIIAFLLRSPVLAEVQLDLDPAAFGGDAQLLAASANIGLTPGEHFYDAMLSGPSGVPVLYHLVWSVDEDIPQPAPFNSIRLDFGCGDTTLAVPLPIYYLPGPSSPPDGPTELGYFECTNPDDPPLAFSLHSPPDQSSGIANPPRLTWMSSRDPEGAAIYYTVYLSYLVDSVSSTPIATGLSDTSFVFTAGVPLSSYW